MYQHILVPVDFSDSSALALKQAKQLAQQFGAKLTVLHVISYVPPGYVAAQIPASLAREDVLVDRTQEYMTEWLDQQGATDCEPLIKTGTPKKEIVEVAGDISADLIVMGAHGETGLARLVGSTTNAVIHHAECDVLAARLSE